MNQDINYILIYMFMSLYENL